MEQSPDAIVAEIERLRGETDAIVGELLNRASLPNVVHGVASAVVDTAETVVNEAASEIPAAVRRDYPLVGGAALSALAGGGTFAFSWMLHGRRDVEEEIDPSPRDGGGRGFLSGDGARLVVTRGQESMLKRVLWVALASATAAAGSMLFKRLSADYWRSARYEEPPRV